VDIAVPRVALSTVNDQFAFTPKLVIVEQGDDVRWRFIGTFMSHTTTSGPACLVPNGLWTAPLSSLSPEFTRQFLEAPGGQPYYCGVDSHCSFYGMNGQVTVTTDISLTATDSLGMLTLSWTGGGPTYRAFRIDNPGFTGSGTVVLTPANGTTQMSLTDTIQPPVGQAAFYLVMNWFATTQF